MSIVLRNHIEASDRSADEIERVLHRDHRLAMICRDVEDLLVDLVELFNRLNQHVAEWQDGLASTSSPEPALVAAEGEWDALYRKLESPFGKAASLVRTLEGEGYELGGKAEFEASCEGLRAVTSVSLDEVAKGVEQIRRGQSRDLGEVWDELWDHSVG